MNVPAASLESAASAHTGAGVLFAATGSNYVALAARAARSVKAVCPGLEIDLFTDAPVDLPVFDRIEILTDPWFRSRIDAMTLTRFERTLHLDADLFAVADFRDVFALLDRFDIALAHDPARNGPNADSVWRKPLPAAFPQFNGGVIAYRSTPEVLGFLRDWSRVVKEEKLKRDQPALREMLWESDLRIATLPPEYNLLRFGEIKDWWTNKAAPRIIHHPQLHQHFSMNRRRIDTLEQLVGPLGYTKLPLLIAADKGVAALTGVPAREPSRADRLRRYLRIVAGTVRRLVWLATTRPGRG